MNYVQHVHLNVLINLPLCYHLVIKSVVCRLVLACGLFVNAVGWFLDKQLSNKTTIRDLDSDVPGQKRWDWRRNHPATPLRQRQQARLQDGHGRGVHVRARGPTSLLHPQYSTSVTSPPCWWFRSFHPMCFYILSYIYLFLYHVILFIIRKQNE